MRFGRMMVLLGVLAAAVAPAQAQLQPLEVAFPNLTFNLGVDIQHAGDGSDRLFVVEQRGVIRVLENTPDATTAPVFLDLESRVLSDSRFGMLGMAFHPGYAGNGYFYVHYTAPNPSRSVIARFQVSDDNPDAADPASEMVVLEVGQPHNFHNGGQLAFGPDGYLYLSFGDGGPGNDPSGHGQNRSTLLGTLLRIDVDTPGDGQAYSIPADNPFVGNSAGYREEIWAWGLRNTWRFSFDPATGRIWGGDNGEDDWEEINILEKGQNYGWRITEGVACFNPPSGCDQAGLTPPLHVYGGSLARRSVIGGYVYHGRQNPELAGQYIYGDFLLGAIWAMAYDGENPPTSAQRSTLFGLLTFGADEAGELYLSSSNDGKIYRFTPTSTATEAPEQPEEAFWLGFNYPNPFSGATTLLFRLPAAAAVQWTLYDVMGRAVYQEDQGLLSPGAHAARVPGRMLSNGHYLLEFRAGSHTQRRMLVIHH